MVMPLPRTGASEESYNTDNCRRQFKEQTFANNRDWVSDMLAKQPESLINLSGGQSLDCLWIGERDQHTSLDL